MTERWKNKKNGRIYTVLFAALDATTGNEDALVVVYQSPEGARYVRDLGEFEEKFEEAPAEEPGPSLAPLTGTDGGPQGP
jgi:hypothetical protein